MIRRQKAFDPARLINAFRTLDCFVIFHDYDFSQPSAPVYARIELSTTEDVRAELIEYLDAKFGRGIDEESYIQIEEIRREGKKVRYQLIVVTPTDVRRDETRHDPTRLLLQKLPREIDNFRMGKKK